ncbi:hypothetical protein A9Q83_08665 [Alphaproteobacteria bacterium 46_93_T64]|nr:hypothetical protein A9Q83_08665 [Alphaproteobacteria bacterium 46_93_T64]
MKIIGVALTVLASVFLFVGSVSADVTGVWETVDGKSHVEIKSCDSDKFCGEIIWLKEPNNEKGAPKTDINNRNEDLRTRGILGINLLKGLEKTGDNEWEDGYIYNPEDGETYSSEMSLADEKTLEVKGCVLFLCKTQTWKRVR